MIFFNKKIGFCEHFAGSLGLLMLYADIPVRIVIGYQGGETLIDSKKNEFILIDNSYAHAWNEIWIKDKGWIRIDPTSWISPARIQDSSVLLNNNSNFKSFKRFINLQFVSNLSRLSLD